jgi:hypothetical protein
MKPEERWCAFLWCHDTEIFGVPISQSIVPLAIERQSELLHQKHNQGDMAETHAQVWGWLAKWPVKEDEDCAVLSCGLQLHLAHEQEKLHSNIITVHPFYYLLLRP